MSPNIIKIPFDDSGYISSYSATKTDQPDGITVMGLLEKMWSPKEREQAIEDKKCFLYLNNRVLEKGEWTTKQLREDDHVEVFNEVQPHLIPDVKPITISTHAGKSISAWWNRNGDPADDPTDYNIRVNGLRVQPDYILQENDIVIVRKVLTK